MPKRNGKWRPVIDYRYVNTQLREHDLPLLVIENMLFGQQGNRRCTLLDLEDGSNQIPLTEDSRQYTVFCTLWGLLEWTVLPIGIKAGTQACERVISDCTEHLQPVTMTYIEDFLSVTEAVYTSAGWKLGYDAMLQVHLDQVIALFETFHKCLLRLRFHTCLMFMTNVKYFGHILLEGNCLPAPLKVDAIRNRTVKSIQTQT